MRKLFILTVGVMLTGLLTATVNAGSNDGAAVRTQEAGAQKTGKSVKSGQVKKNKPGTSLDASYKKRIAAKKRAAEMRKKLIRESQGQPAK